MNHRTVAAVFEEAASVLSSERSEIVVPIASIKPSRVRALALRIRPLIFEKASSMGG